MREVTRSNHLLIYYLLYLLIYFFYIFIYIYLLFSKCSWLSFFQFGGWQVYKLGTQLHVIINWVHVPVHVWKTCIDHKHQTLYPKLFNLRRVLSMARFVDTRPIAFFHLFFGKLHNLLHSVRFLWSFIKLLNMVTVAIAFAVAVTADSAVNVARRTLSICIARVQKGNATKHTNVNC